MGPDDEELDALRQKAEQHVAQGKHRPASRALEALRQRQPSLARATWFMTLEEAIEDLRDQAGSARKEAAAATLPDRSLRPSRVILGLLLFLGLALVGLSTLAATGRALHVVNATPFEATVRVQGREQPLVVAPGGHETVEVGEGRKTVVVELPDGSRSHEVELRTGPLQRLSSNSAFILNVRGAAALLWREGVYTNVPDTRSQARPPRVEFGQPFSVFHDVDYVFRPLPTSTLVEGQRLTDTRLSQLTVLDGAPSEVVHKFPPNVDLDTQLAYLELHLRLAPTDAATIVAYRQLGATQGAGQRVSRFLRELREAR